MIHRTSLYRAGQTDRGRRHSRVAVRLKPLLDRKGTFAARYRMIIHVKGHFSHQLTAQSTSLTRATFTRSYTEAVLHQHTAVCPEPQLHNINLV